MRFVVFHNLLYSFPSSRTFTHNFLLSRLLFSLLFAYVISIDPYGVIAIIISLRNPFLCLPSEIKSLYYIFYMSPL